jgi:DNA-binding transcriptional ArsR family regulator
MLRRDDLSAGEIADQLPIAKSTLSGHLNILKAANLVLAERSGTTIVYSLNVAAYEEIAAALMSFFQVGTEQAAKRAAKQVPKEGVS